MLFLFACFLAASLFWQFALSHRKASARAAVLLLALFLVSAANLPAQSVCDAVLRDGVFNLTTSDFKKTVQENLYEWYKSTSWSSYKKAQDSGFKGGFPFKGVPIEISGSHSEEEFREWKTAVDQGRIREFTSEEFMQIVQRSVSVELVDRWLECIKSTSGVGLICSHTVNGDLGITFGVRFIPNSGGDFPPVVTPYGWQVTGARVPNGFGPGSEIPIGGGSLILTRDSSPTDVNIVLNTTKGSCTRFIPGKPIGPIGPGMPGFVLEKFTASSAVASHPEVRVTVPAGYKIISGGCNVRYTGFGNLLTHCYPLDSRTWIGKSKDHSVADPAAIEASVIAVYDPNDEWIVVMQSATSAPSAVPSVTATLPPPYALTGGGAFVNYSGPGQLLTASYPDSVRSWTAKAKQHGLGFNDTAPVTSVAIGIRPRNGLEMPVPVIFQQRSDIASHPSASAKVDSGYTMTGGGAFADWRVWGSLLTSSQASDVTTWSVSSKDHLFPYGEAISITAYAIGIKFLPKACQILVGPDRLTFPSASSSANLSVQADTGCGFSVASGDYWLRLDPKGELTSGTRLINVRADDNTGAARQGSIAIAGRTISVTQEAAQVCSPFVVRLSSTKFDVAGGVATAEIAGQPNCFGAAQTPADFVTFSPSSWQGSATLTITVGPNRTGAARAAVLNFGAGSPVPITQDGPQSCAGLTVRLSASQFDAAGGVGTAEISGTAGCSFTAQSDAPFVTFKTASGQVPAKIDFNVVLHSGPDSRTAKLTIAGQQLPLVQNGTQKPPVMPADPDAVVLAGLTHQTKWLYFVTPSGYWYIVKCTGNAATPGTNPGCSVLLLKGIDTATNDLAWKSVHNAPQIGPYSAAGNVFAAVNVSPDGRTVEFGDLAGSSADAEVTQLVRGRFPVKWHYISVDNDRRWYIVSVPEPGGAAALPVLMLKAVDPKIEGGIVWKPIQSYGAFAGFPAVGQRYESVTVSPDGKAVTFGAIK